MLISSKTVLTEMPRITYDQVSEHLVAHPVKVTHKINPTVTIQI